MYTEYTVNTFLKLLDYQMNSIKKSIKSSGNYCMLVLALIAAQTGYGMYPVLVKKMGVEDSVNPVVFSMMRDVGCVPVLFVLALISHGWVGLPKWRDCMFFSIMGTTGVFLNQLSYLIGVYLVGGNIASIFNQMIPIWTTVLAIMTCTEKFPSFKRITAWLKIVGILFAVVGAIEMSFFQSTRDSSLSRSPWLGFISLLVSSSSFSVYMVVQKRFIFNKPDNIWRTHPIWVLAWSYCPGSACIVLTSLYYASTPSAFYVTHNVWVVLIYAILITSSFCYIIVAWANSRTTSSIVTAFWPFQAITCFIGSYFVNNQLLNRFQYIGAVLVISGLLAVVIGEYLEEKKEKATQHNTAVNDNITIN